MPLVEGESHTEVSAQACLYATGCMFDALTSNACVASTSAPNSLKQGPADMAATERQNSAGCQTETLGRASGTDVTRFYVLGDRELVSSSKIWAWPFASLCNAP